MDRNYMGFLKEVMFPSTLSGVWRTSFSLTIASLVLAVQFLTEFFKVIPEGVGCIQVVVERGFPLPWAQYATPHARTICDILLVGLMIDVAFFLVIAYLGISIIIYLLK